LRRREDVAGRFAALAPDGVVRRRGRGAGGSPSAGTAGISSVPAAAGGTTGISAVAGGSGTAVVLVVSASGSGATSGAA